MLQPTHEIELSKPQYRLITTPNPYPAFVGGFGSGKTEALINRGIALKLKYPTGNIAYYMPTFDLVGTFGIPRFEEKLSIYKIPYKTIKSPRPYIAIEDAGQFIFRTMDNPNRIVGYEVMDSLIDELDILKTKDAENAWNKILARNRQKKPDGAQNTIAVGCTPEGFKFMYQKWGKEEERKPGYELIKASTYSNLVNLPANYIQDLLDSYPTALIMAYIHGEFTNLLSGSVYPDFSREHNRSFETVGMWQEKQPEDIHVGLDFNVMNMAAIINVERNGFPHAVDEITKVFDTPAMIEALKGKYPHNRIFVYPDASGSSRKTVGASESDISLLRQAEFHVMARAANPMVKDRVLSMNVMIKNGKGERRFFVNTDMCPKFTEALETQAYDDKGEPDKSTGLDHPIDAEGYFMYYNFPAKGKPISHMEIVGI